MGGAVFLPCFPAPEHAGCWVGPSFWADTGISGRVHADQYSLWSLLWCPCAHSELPSQGALQDPESVKSRLLEAMLCVDSSACGSLCASSKSAASLSLRPAELLHSSPAELHS